MRDSLRGSMSAKGNCYDNTCAESFFHSLKVECIHGERFATRDAMKQTVFEYIETDYNSNRLHSTLGYLSPLDLKHNSSQVEVSEFKGLDQYDYTPIWWHNPPHVSTITSPECFACL